MENPTPTCNRPTRPRWQHRAAAHGGFTYIGLLILLAILALASASTLTLGSFLQQRANEAELLFIGAQYAAALRTFVESTPAGQKQLPSRLEDLLRDPRYPNVKRHLRRIYADPMTGKQDWALVPAKGGGFIGIHSRSDAAPIRKTGFDTEFLALTNKKKYSEWVFGMPASEAMNIQLTPPSALESDPSPGPAVTPPRALTTLP